MIQERINNNLKALYNVHDDIVYKRLICDEDGVIPDAITKPTDIDIGAIASQIEYLRRLSIDLLKQIFINEASQEFLKYQLEEFFGSLQLEDESDEQWVQRTIAIVFQHKVSRATIIFALRPFSSEEPQIVNVVTDNAFADFSYAGIYVKDKVFFDNRYVFILPAISEDYSSSFFTIKIILQDTLSSDIYTVQNIIENIIAAGISVVLQINYT
jgi:hypothetical protein